MCSLGYDVDFTNQVSNKVTKLFKTANIKLEKKIKCPNRKFICLFRLFINRNQNF